MANDLKPMKRNQEILLDRLRSSRKARGLTQQDVANLMEISRTTLVAIEKGERPISSAELVSAARAIGVPVNELLRPQPVAEDFVAQFRLKPDAGAREHDLLTAVRQLQEAADDYVTLEKIANAPLVRRYPVEAEVSLELPAESGEALAGRERNRLGLGDAPLHGLRQLLEADVGLRIFVFELPGDVGGLFINSDEYGACIAINAKHPAERQRWSLAHEYAHFLAQRSRTEVTQLGGYKRVPAEERFADAFAERFLMPESGLKRRFLELRQSRSDGVTPADLLNLADLYQVSFEALVLTLENLGLVRRGTWDRLLRGGFKVGEAREMLRMVALPPDVEALPLRYRYLAVEAYLEGNISEGQFARFLRMDRASARRLAHRLASRVEIDQAGELSAVEMDSLGPIDLGDQ